jgi:hypothetical protein
MNTVVSTYRGFVTLQGTLNVNKKRHEAAEGRRMPSSGMLRRVAVV